MNTLHRIIIGDSRNMKQVDNCSIHLVITSPPYWQLKDYGSTDQIGFDDSYEHYINHLNLVWSECFRVLKPGCRICINIGDQFARSVYYGRYKVIPIRTEIIKFCESIGLDYMGAIIWQKVTSTHTTGGASIMGSFPFPRNGILKLDYEFILIFKKPGTSIPVDEETKEKSRMTIKEWNSYFSGHWCFPGEKQHGHIAMFPAELPKRLIKMFSFVGETVLDPFLGSGTTSLAALHLERHSIGYEINGEYISTIKNKLPFTKKSFLGKIVIETENQEKINYSEKIGTFSYVFKDPVKIDKKIDVKKNRYGSRLDSKRESRERYFSVKEVTGPTSVLLNDGRQIHLLGIKVLKNKIDDAITFLREKTKGTKVFIRLDENFPETEHSLKCYLYLANKTYLNAHLVKNGLAEVDTDIEFKHKNRLLKHQLSAQN